MIYSRAAARPDCVEASERSRHCSSRATTTTALPGWLGLGARMLASSRTVAGRIPRLARCVLSRHLITSSPSKLASVESILQSARPSSLAASSSASCFCSHRLHHHSACAASASASASPAMSLDSVTAALAQLSITSAATVAHAPTNSPASWRAALEASADAPKGFELVKTLVYKPKTAKTATPVPVLLVARETSDVPSGALGKVLNLKELRLASEDLLKEFFNLDKNSRESFVYPWVVGVRACWG